jgi:hypothetical protein
MKKEYDLSGPWRTNPYASRITAKGRAELVRRMGEAERRLVCLDDDVFAEFSDSASVNEALRLVMQLRKLKKGGPRGPRTKRAA